MKRGAWQVWLAEGLGLGGLPAAPGTWGTVGGLAWTLALLAGGPPVFAAGTVLGLAAAVLLCGAAERHLGRPDPPSVVLDEIAAVPVCFAGWMGLHALRTGEALRPAGLFADGAWLVTLAVLGAFRFFDVLKPWPVRTSQSLPGGWGITADDLLAAGYVNGVIVPVLVLLGLPAKGP